MADMEIRDILLRSVQVIDIATAEMSEFYITIKSEEKFRQESYGELNGYISGRRLFAQQDVHVSLTTTRNRLREKVDSMPKDLPQRDLKLKHYRNSWNYLSVAVVKFHQFVIAGQGWTQKLWQYHSSGQDPRFYSEVKPEMWASQVRAAIEEAKAKITDTFPAVQDNSTTTSNTEDQTIVGAPEAPPWAEDDSVRIESRDSYLGQLRDAFGMTIKQMELLMRSIHSQISDQLSTGPLEDLEERMTVKEFETWRSSMEWDMQQKLDKGWWRTNQRLLNVPMNERADMRECCQPYWSHILVLADGLRILMLWGEESFKAAQQDKKQVDYDKLKTMKAENLKEIASAKSATDEFR